MQRLSAPLRPARIAPASRSWRVAWLALAIGVAASAFAPAPARAGPSWIIPGGEPSRGARLIEAYGCAQCHTVPGVGGANGNVGPPLTRFGDRTYIAGMLRNTPPNLVRWIRDPQKIVPGNAMPDMGVSEADARDIAAYLYTLH